MWVAGARSLKVFSFRPAACKGNRQKGKLANRGQSQTEGPFGEPQK